MLTFIILKQPQLTNFRLIKKWRNKLILVKPILFVHITTKFPNLGIEAKKISVGPKIRW